MWVLYNGKKHGVVVYVLNSKEAEVYGGPVGLEVIADNCRALIGLSEQDALALGTSLVRVDALTPRRIKLGLDDSTDDGSV